MQRALVFLGFALLVAVGSVAVWGWAWGSVTGGSTTPARPPQALRWLHDEDEEPWPVPPPM